MTNNKKLRIVAPGHLSVIHGEVASEDAILDRARYTLAQSTIYEAFGDAVGSVLLEDDEGNAYVLRVDVTIEPCCPSEASDILEAAGMADPNPDDDGTMTDPESQR